VHAISRRALPASTAPSFKAQIDSDVSAWPAAIKAFAPRPSILFSALGTTRAKAGGVANQRKIDFDLALALATAAREAGATTYVLVSSAGANASSSFAYMKMKGELDAAVAQLGFERTVIMRPGFLVGVREESKGAFEWVTHSVANALGRISGDRLKDGWAQDAGTVARAAVVAGQMCVEGKRQKGVWMLEQAEIVKLGKGR